MTDAIQKAREALDEAIDFADQDFQVLTPTGEEMVNRWRAALAALDAETEVKVKPLVWDLIDEDHWAAETETRARAILADRAAQAERMARLEEALKPFAYVADVEDEAGRDDPDDDRIWVVQAHGCQLAEFTIDDFRRARALSQEGSDA